MVVLSDLDRKIHKCTACKDRGLSNIVKHYPIVSFGDLNNKPLIVVGLNPSTKEYEDNYVSSDPDPAKRHRSQMSYFDSGYYSFFQKLEKFFQGKAKTTIGWKKSPWEKIGFTDLAKCPTRNNKGQWTQLKTSQKKRIIQNCESYLIDQIETCRPSVLFAYGTDVCRWFYPKYHRDKDAFMARKWYDIPVILVPQSQTPYPRQVITAVQDSILEHSIHKQIYHFFRNFARILEK
jgi:hypothetical protein